MENRYSLLTQQRQHQKSNTPLASPQPSLPTPAVIHRYMPILDTLEYINPTLSMNTITIYESDPTLALTLSLTQEHPPTHPPSFHYHCSHTQNNTTQKPFM